MPTLQYMSDLHLERIKYDFTITKVAPILILAGDIGRFCDYDLYRDFLARQCAPDQFDMVLLVAGNHEFYGSSRETGLAAAEKLTKEPSMHGKLQFLNRSRIDLPGSLTTILGCTLHSHIAAGYTKLTNDFARIKEWSVKSHNVEHETDLAWLKHSLLNLKQEDPQRRAIIITHYAPLFDRVSHPKNENNAVSQCFSSNALDSIQRAGLVPSLSSTHWIFGHTHWNVRLKRGNFVVLSNQLCNDDKNLTWYQKLRLFRPYNPSATIVT
ncbi:uncharacterized protein RCC_03258 [Ramularia collo-cygni]|uniref:Calcineurin-like phosphoesterase domain-containing protein n=1 Tax=Ramularia collo-cygni TaxID=112498 RepID=A0A2D3V4L2_9PEZI|nr:uncharacterized protein RCC_03258 [Ramularia collo-cygni]CZT17424.1 uncharacterized protein RCC_03258 [Ramularia collo-cygni]